MRASTEPRSPPKLLRTHVTQGPDLVAGMSQIVMILGQSSQAEVRHPEAAPAIDQQVGGFDVAMNDADLMRVIKRVGRLNGPPHGRMAVSPHRSR